MPQFVKLSFDPVPIAHASPLSVAVRPADPKAVTFRVPALGAFEQRPKSLECNVVTILASDGPSVNPLVVVALGAARAEQLIVREIGEPQMTYAAIRIYDSLVRNQINTAPMAHRPPSSLSSGLSYEDGVAVPVFAIVASHPRRKP
ncbi:hypothetical protein PWG15_36120 (plasmid) [Ensifer adhaerens]|uniref:hypothetical protein n=1 Tax=Ensifer adhaerens TaxID=106592 RepID=UPI0023A97A88|nr:hypothetical protein [Ensifer adhaerens]WDZ82121.1 hypothetical protein PWG15_36120 [Ensifer adhaerens]